MSQIKKLFSAVTLILALSLPAAAQDEPYSGTINQERYEKFKYEADTAYDKRDFAKAYKIYSSVLASNGDAYSQYMTGYMMRAGLGTPKDPTSGAAWMVLGAQQGNYKLYEAANVAMAALSPGKERKANKLYKDLMRKYSNCALKAQLIEELKDHIGLGSRKGPMSERMSMVYGDTAFTANDTQMRQRLSNERKAYKKGCTR